MNRKPSLPVDALLPSILASLAERPNLVLEAAPGAGKTTRVPPALLELVRGEIIVLEPRRIAARLAARRVAWELNEQVGETVGYQVRFEEAIGPRTRLRFVTDGVFTRRLLSDPTLKGVDAIVLDEFHERHLESDFALALLKRLQQTRPDLRLIVMSATLDAAPVARYLGDCPILRSEGRVFPLSVKHLPYSPDPLHTQVRNAVELLLREQQQQSSRKPHRARSNRNTHSSSFPEQPRSAARSASASRSPSASAFSSFPFTAISRPPSKTAPSRPAVSPS